jgi:bifunctional N-acetylglucosamine-1-phosphate-uridyltransferase/glucosamine-1-phosphate-acetyltransferase GlmU-like protein
LNLHCSNKFLTSHYQIRAIIEQKDANIEQLKICEVNTGIMAVDSGLLKSNDQKQRRTDKVMAKNKEQTKQ